MDTITCEEFQRLIQQGRAAREPSGHKYHARPTCYGGRWYDSQAEALRASQLDLLVRGGQVLFWSNQPVFELGIRDRLYKADFFVVGRSPEGGPMYWVEEVKGFQTQQWKRNKSLWRTYGRYPLVVLQRVRDGWKREEVEPRRN